MDDTNNSGNLVCLPEKKKIRLSGGVAFFFFLSKVLLRCVLCAEEKTSKRATASVPSPAGWEKKKNLLFCSKHSDDDLTSDGGSITGHRGDSTA